MSEDVFDPASAESPRGPAGRAVVPKAAASLILVDRRGSHARVLMGRRHARASFMPERWVFPGGRTDPGDARAPAATELSTDTEAQLRKACAPGAPARLPRALAIAAVRETFEETGLRLALAARLAPVAVWADFAADGLWPHLAALRLVGRAITPPGLPRRFDARFFEADAALLDRMEPQASPELDEVAWLTFEQARTRETARVTRLLLTEARARLDDPERAPLLVRVERGHRRAEPM